MECCQSGHGDGSGEEAEFETVGRIPHALNEIIYKFNTARTLM